MWLQGSPFFFPCYVVSWDRWHSTGIILSCPPLLIIQYLWQLFEYLYGVYLRNMFLLLFWWSFKILGSNPCHSFICILMSHWNSVWFVIRITRTCTHTRTSFFIPTSWVWVYRFCHCQPHPHPHTHPILKLSFIFILKLGSAFLPLSLSLSLVCVCVTEGQFIGLEFKFKLESSCEYLFISTHYTVEYCMQSSHSQ